MKNSRGFTLIELSIVLVIIGLIIGGVLMGRDLILGAENKQIASYQQEFATKWNTFKLKYDCIPGDCATATELFGAAAGCTASARTDNATCDGDGNGKISWSGPNEGANGLAYDHLHHAGLFGPYNVDYDVAVGYSSLVPIPNTTMYIGSNALDRASLYYSVTRTGGINALQFARRQNFVPHQPRAAIISPSRMHNIDLKVDDGLPGHGHVRGWHGETYGVNPAQNEVCVNLVAGEYEYVVTSNEMACVFQFKLD